MNTLKALVLVVCGLFSSVAFAAENEYTFKGPWKTTNRKLDGVQTCVVTRLSETTWTGRFYGVWQGVDFDYTVKLDGPPDRLSGRATIDGARYEWTGSINTKKFVGSFTGDRYTGSFDMDRK